MTYWSVRYSLRAAASSEKTSIAVGYCSRRLLATLACLPPRIIQLSNWYYAKGYPVKTLSLKLPERLHALLLTAVLERQKGKSELVREALAAYLVNTNRPGSFADLTGDLAGKIKGPRDLSTHPRHFDGFGQ